MIDNSQLVEAIERQIALAIEKYISEDFRDDLRQAQINNIIQRSVEKTTQELLSQNSSKLHEVIVDNVKNNGELTTQILSESIPYFKNGIDEQFKILLKSYISEEIATRDWQNRIQNAINQAVSRSSSELLSGLDSDSLIADTINQCLKLNDHEVMSAFSGIRDTSSGSKELVIMPECVVVENELVSKKIKNVGNIETDSLRVSDLSVTGTINVDNTSWQNLAESVSEKTFSKMDKRFLTETVDRVLETAKNDGIAFDNIRIGNQPLLDGNKLSDRITETAIEKTGTLKSLSVSGNADFSSTLHVVNGKIGVNTENPDMAVNIWDQEVSISFGKISSDRAFIGSTRKNEIAIGVNKRGDILIDSDGTTTINKLRVGRYSMGHADQVPGWAGTKGDLVFNTSIGKDGVFAWVCLGEFRWKSLKSA